MFVGSDFISLYVFLSPRRLSIFSWYSEFSIITVLFVLSAFKIIRFLFSFKNFLVFLVISLYTNIPIELATKIIKKNWQKIKKYTDIPESEFLKATELTLNSTYFQHNNKLYKQIEGCAMGTSISSVVAQIDREEMVLGKMDFNIPFFYRYVDDCITVVPKDKIKFILEQFNNYHKNLQFTIETEENNKINFLDITLHHNDQKIKTQWYTKTTWSSRYLNFNSNHPLSQKKTVIIGLADRAIQLSDPEYRQEAIEKAKNALKLNNYPKKLINNTFKARINKFYNSLQAQNTKKNEKQVYLTLPYINGLSQPLQTLFKKQNITVCHKACNLLSNCFSKLKSKTPKNKKSNVIYQIPCNDCSGLYIGQTSQYLENRLKGHKYDKKNTTALTKHELSKKHTFDYNNTKILKTENNQKKREFYEMIEIHKNKSAINDKKDVNNLSKIYTSLLN
jgi:hypothetical protein